MANVSNLVKSIQDVMRKDAGTYGDAQRLEQLGWMFFLKIFDDREKELELLRDDYRSPLPRHLRWSDWAANEEGFTGDGLVTVRDAGKLALKDRVAVNQAVADQNRDAKAVYREIAVANGHPEWEGRIREVFAKQWIESARKGWWYQSGGAWKQK